MFPPGSYRGFMCFSINLKPPQGVLESSCRPLKLKHIFNRSISMKVNWACLLISRLRTVPLIHTWDKATTVFHCWQLSSSKATAEVWESHSRVELLLTGWHMCVCFKPGFKITTSSTSQACIINPAEVIGEIMPRGSRLPRWHCTQPVVQSIAHNSKQQQPFQTL